MIRIPPTHPCLVTNDNRLATRALLLVPNVNLKELSESSNRFDRGRHKRGFNSKDEVNKLRKSVGILVFKINFALKKLDDSPLVHDSKNLSIT